MAKLFVSNKDESARIFKSDILERLDLSIVAANTFLSNPLFGTGLGTFIYNVPIFFFLTLCLNPRFIRLKDYAD